MGTASQKDIILNHLKNNKYLTSLEATKKYYILRPSNRIQELKREGYDIQTQIVWKKRRNGSTTHYARYSLMQ